MVEVIVKDLVVNFPKFVCQDRASDISCRYRHQEELQNELAVITAWDLPFANLELAVLHWRARLNYSWCQHMFGTPA